MKHFAIVAWDGPDAETIRAEARDAHFARIETILDTLAVAGPMRGPDGAFTGSLIVIKAEDADAAREIFEADPYYVAGVWARYEIHDFVPAAGEWIGGTIW